MSTTDNTRQLRQPHGELDAKSYPFDISPWDALKPRSEKLFTLAITSDEGMDPSKVAARLEFMLDKLKTTIEAVGIGETKYSVYSKKNRGQSIGGVELFEQYANDIKSPWYWDDVYLEVSGGDFTAIMQPETDGVDLAIYVTGRRAKDFYESLLSLVDQES